MTGLLVFVIATFGGIVLYDAKHKAGSPTPGTPPAPNWKWKDDWDGGKPVVPVPPVTPPAPTPQPPAGTYAEAVQRSRETGTPVLAFFTADWCGWCKKMKAETMPDPRVQAALKQFIFVYVDVDREPTAGKKFGVTGLPSYVITNGREEQTKLCKGYMTPDAFVAWLGAAQQRREFAATVPFAPDRVQPTPLIVAPAQPSCPGCRR
jgi:thiol-disulfide isomerase/thioredoxin